MDYSFASLGSDGFEQLAQALACAELGTGVKPLGRGRDKGRDAYFRGQVNHESSDGSGPWNGYGVIQAKHLGRDVDTTSNITWVKRQIAGELEKWLPREKGQSPERRDPPEYYLLITNATLSPEGFDACVAELGMYARKLGMKDWGLWSREPISRLLDNHVNIRQTYLHFIVSGDMIAALESSYTANDVPKLGKQISVNAAVELGERQWARLGDSGLESEERLRLATVAIDMPSRVIDPLAEREDWPVVATIRQVLQHGEESMRKSDARPHRGVLLIGGPGQGKSTIAQLVCQVYRAAMLDANSMLLLEQTRLVDEVKDAVARIGLKVPSYRRWPVYVELSKFGDEITRDEDVSLLKYIASQVRAEGETLKTNQIVKWRKAWPWLVVLDGLDEVANPRVRDRVLRAISEFLTDCNANDADVMVIGTTRPQGYHGELDSFELEQLELQFLSPDQSLSYGILLADSRHAEDPIAHRNVIDRLTEAAANEATSRLMTTPLQVTIMSTLLERLSRVPETRHALFDEYYKAIYSREKGKAGSFGTLLATYQNVIDYVHEQVALYLHVQAEMPGQAEALLHESELSPLIIKRLDADGYPPKDAEKLAAEVVKAVRNRVVLLVGLREDHVGFEVRSIQEYLAARALTSGQENEILDRLEVLIPSAHWRNTWLLAAGRLQGHSNPQIIDSLLLRLEQTDTASSLAMEVGPGERLALDLLEDQFATNVPRIRRVLFARALGMLGHWGDSRLRQLAQVAAAEINSSAEAQDVVRSAVRRGLSSTGPSRSSTVSLLTAWQKTPGKPGTLANHELEKATGWRPAHNVRRPKKAIGELLGSALDQGGLDGAQRGLLTAAINAFKRISVPVELSAAEVATVTKRNDFVIMPEVLHALADGVVRGRLIAASAKLPESEGAAAVYLRQYFLVYSDSKPVSDSPLISPPGVGLFQWA